MKSKKKLQFDSADPRPHVFNRSVDSYEDNGVPRPLFVCDGFMLGLMKAL